MLITKSYSLKFILMQDAITCHTSNSNKKEKKKKGYLIVYLNHSPKN